jgi:hypothetical protein
MPPPDDTDPPVIPWNDTVRQGGVIRIFVRSNIRGSRWAGVVDKAIKDMNTLLGGKGFSMQFKKVAKEEDAEVTIETTPSNDLHGQTFLDRQGGTNLQRATIKVPATPRASKIDPKAREVGAGVRLYIVAHELVHALGLSNAAHSRDDVFTRDPHLILPGVVAPGRGVVREDAVQAYDGTIMQGIELGATTLANLKKAWP